MPATSKAQQRFFGMAEHNPGAMKGPMPKMSKGQMHDFAATKTAKLPERKGDSKTKPSGNLSRLSGRG